MLNIVLQVTVNNDESDESYDSAWSYMQHIESNALVGHDRRTFHKELTDTKVMISYYHHAFLRCFCWSIFQISVLSLVKVLYSPAYRE